MKKRSVILALVMVLAIPVGAQAFNNSRRGFILNLGAGGAATVFKQRSSGGGESIESATETRGSLLTDFRIGFGPSDQAVIYWIGHVSWFSIKNAFENKVTMGNGLVGVGVTYFVSPRAPSWTVTGALGFWKWAPLSATSFDPSNSWTGFGFMVGTGYEFSPHTIAEVSISHGNPPKSAEEGKAESNSTVFGVTLSYLAY